MSVSPVGKVNRMRSRLCLLIEVAGQAGIRAGRVDASISDVGWVVGAEGGWYGDCSAVSLVLRELCSEGLAHGRCCSPRMESGSSPARTAGYRGRD